MMSRPVTRPPVKETTSTPASELRGAPAVAPAPSTRFATPRGSPASVSAFIRRITVCGVSSRGLSTKVLPAAHPTGHSRGQQSRTAWTQLALTQPRYPSPALPHSAEAAGPAGFTRRWKARTSPLCRVHVVGMGGTRYRDRC